MRLGLVRYKYAAGGGAEKTLLMLARGLAGRGHEVHVGVSQWSGEEPPGVIVHQTGAGGSPDRFAQAALALMQGLKLDTWLSLDRVPGSPILRTGDGVHAAWLKRRRPYQSALQRFYTGLRPRHREVLNLERRCFCGAGLKKVIANSRMVAGELVENFSLKPDNIELIYNGVDAAAAGSSQISGVRSRLRSELGVAGSAPVALFLGSGFQRKGLAFAIRALDHVADVQLWVAGRDRAGAFRMLAKRLGLGDRVRFLGERKDSAELLIAADVMCLPTIYDPCANSVLEALALQTPVVTTKANGASELMDEGVNGWVVDAPDNGDVLAGAIQKALLLKTPFAHRVPGFDEMIEKTVACMEAVAAKSSREPT